MIPRTVTLSVSLSARPAAARPRRPAVGRRACGVSWLLRYVCVVTRVTVPRCDLCCVYLADYRISTFGHVMAWFSCLIMTASWLKPSTLDTLTSHHTPSHAGIALAESEVRASLSPGETARARESESADFD